MFRTKTFRTVAKGLLLLLVLGGAVGIGKHNVMADWRTASREPMGIAPDPAEHKEAIVQVYGARAFSWRGIFGVHTWLATKPTHADTFTVYDIAVDATADITFALSSVIFSAPAARAFSRTSSIVFSCCTRKGSTNFV